MINPHFLQSRQTWTSQEREDVAGSLKRRTAASRRVVPADLTNKMDYLKVGHEENFSPYRSRKLA